jgi:hypothetical protein
MTFNLGDTVQLNTVQTARIVAPAAGRSSETQLAHAERLTAEREKIERYYRQQECAVAGMAIDNIRQAKGCELLERRRVDLAALDHRLTLVPDLTLVGMVVVTT